MAHYAKIKDSIVLEVIVADQSVIDSFEDPTEWIQTSYNTHGGVHSDGGTPLRKNYASIGYTYDTDRDDLRYMDCVYMHMGLYGNNPDHLRQIRIDNPPVKKLFL